MQHGSTHKIIDARIYEDSNSSQNQESFVLTVLQEKRNGFYVEIGSHHPVICNNTYLLENKFGWSGLAVEIDKEYQIMYNRERKNPCVNSDALAFNYTKYFEENDFPKQIDYLQIDVDDNPRDANLLALIQLPLSTYRFNIITIEHDCVRDYTFHRMRDVQRFILTSLGYELVIQGDSEDFWVDKTYIPQENYWCLYSVGRFM